MTFKAIRGGYLTKPLATQTTQQRTIRWPVRMDNANSPSIYVIRTGFRGIELKVPLDLHASNATNEKHLVWRLYFLKSFFQMLSSSTKRIQLITAKSTPDPLTRTWKISCENRSSFNTRDEIDQCRKTHETCIRFPYSCTRYPNCKHIRNAAASSKPTLAKSAWVMRVKGQDHFDYYLYKCLWKLIYSFTTLWNMKLPNTFDFFHSLK